MTPITERLAEALREIAEYVAVNEMSIAPQLPVAPYNMQFIARTALAEYDRLRTHPAEGGEGREPVRCNDPNCEEANRHNIGQVNTCVHFDFKAAYARQLAAAPPPQPVAPERGEAKAVAWRSRYTMEAGRLSDWHYVDRFVPVASPSTGYEVEALYTAPPPPDRVQPERVDAVPGDDDFVAPPPSEWSKAGQRRLMEALEAAPPTDATDRVEAVECDYCGGSGFINVLDEDGEPVLDFCDAPAHDTPNDASGVTEAAVQALKDSLWSSWGASRQTTDWPNMQQLRAALEAADRARTAPQSPRFRDPTIEDAEKCPRCGRRRTTGAGRLPECPSCCTLVCHCTCHNDPLYCRECKDCDCHKPPALNAIGAKMGERP